MKEWIDEYCRGYEMLLDSIRGLTEEEIRFKPGKDHWSIHQILIHISDSELVSTHRMKKVLTEDEPLLPSFDQNEWVDELNYDQLDRELYLQLFKSIRSSMIPILNHLTDKQFGRVGVYADAGRFSFKELLEYRVQHIRGHLHQIERVKKAYRERSTDNARGDLSMSVIEQQLKELGLELPEAVPPLYHYVPVTVHQGVAYVSGQVPRINGEIPYPGKVGRDVTVEQAQELAEFCVLKGLSCLKAAVGNLDDVEKVLKVTGYVQTAPGFTEPSKVMDAASELLEKIFGEKGRHARTAIGASELPNNTPVEIDFIIAVK